MTSEIIQYSWPLDKLGSLIQTVAKVTGLSSDTVAIAETPSEIIANQRLIRSWAQQVAVKLRIELEPITVSYRELVSFMETAAPAIFHLTYEDAPYFLGVVKSRKGRVSLLDSDHRIVEVSLDCVRAAICSSLEVPLIHNIDQMLANGQVPQRRILKARAAILQGQLSQTNIHIWRLELSPSVSFRKQLRRIGVEKYIFGFLTSYILQYILWLASWAVVGHAIFLGTADRQWFVAWALLLLTIVPLRFSVSWWQGEVAIRVGGLLQRRLLFGTLRQHPDEIRHMGIGQLKGRVFDAETVETLALKGGFVGLVGLVELVLAAWVLKLGAGGWGHVLLLIAWLGITAVFTYRFYKSRGCWTKSRRRLTHDLIERMVGYRTRLAQMPSQNWHRDEDNKLSEYLKESVVMDRTWIYLRALSARGWLLIGLIGLIPAFVNSNIDMASVAISIGGILSIELALRKLGQSLNQMVEAVIAWQQIKPVYMAATRFEPTGVTKTANVMPLEESNKSSRHPIVETFNLRFNYQENGTIVLKEGDLCVRKGDRILLEGASGSGKSTFVSLLTGLRTPQQGFILCCGVDRETMGATEWRRRIVAAPQFQENHVFSGYFLFNLLMGRNWPTMSGDTADAVKICTELGLDGLLQQMPGGVMQIVGETGWQLSHGERSRLYIARALLQHDADLIILDESFAALDPKNFYRAMDCTLKRGKTLIIIAH